MIAADIDHGRDPGPEAGAGLGDVLLGHLSPYLVDGGLQRVDACMRHTAHLPLHIALDGIVQRGTVWGGGRPHGPGPEGCQVVVTPLLYHEQPSLSMMVGMVPK